jgi:hypothetical protein
MAPLRWIGRQSTEKRRSRNMADFIYLAAGLAFFALMGLYAYVCDRV